MEIEQRAQRVTVSVRRRDEALAYDLELPADVVVEDLASLVALGFQWDRTASGEALHYQVEVQPPGRLLQPTESLASAGVWDGAWLIFQPAGVAMSTARGLAPSANAGGAPRPGAGSPPSPGPLTVAPSSSPIAGWHSLGISLPASAQQERQGGSAAPAPLQSPGSGGPEPGAGAAAFVWKEIEDEL